MKILMLFMLLFGGAMLLSCDNSNEGESPPPPPPPPTDPADYTSENVCDAEFCATDDTLSQTCQDFLGACFAANPDANEEECIGGGLVICQNPDINPADVCNYQLCGTNQTLHDECLDFMSICVPESVNAEECVGAMLFFCRGT